MYLGKYYLKYFFINVLDKYNIVFLVQYVGFECVEFVLFIVLYNVQVGKVYVNIGVCF